MLDSQDSCCPRMFQTRLAERTETTLPALRPRRCRGGIRIEAGEIHFRHDVGAATLKTTYLELTGSRRDE